MTGAISDEARALYNIGAAGPRGRHGLVYRAPVINISRDPRWGRIQECFGEDPYLVGVLATRYVRGLQGEKRDLLATLDERVLRFFDGARYVDHRQEDKNISLK